MPEYLRPGVYYERVDASAPGIAALRTDVAAFIGIAEKGPLNTPVPVQSVRQFQAHFGDFTGSGYLAYAVHAFFEGGGRRCWVIRVASAENEPRARTASVVIENASGPAWQIEASSPGAWGNELSVALRTERRAQTVSAPGQGHAEFATVDSISGFARASLIRISQPDGLGGIRRETRVVSMVDANRNRIYWVHPEAGMGLSHDRPLFGFDRNVPWTIERLSWMLQVYRRGNLLYQTPDLEVVSQADRYADVVQRSPDYPTRLTGQDGLPRPAPPVVVRDLTNGVIPEPLIVEEGARLNLAGGADGLASLTISDFTGEPFSLTDSDEVQTRRRRGIAALDLVDEISIVAVPDIVIRPNEDPVYEPVKRPDPDPCQICPPLPEPLSEPRQPGQPNELPPIFSNDQIYQVQAQLLQHCETRGDRFAILDPPFPAARQDEVGVSAIRAWRARFDSSYGALYYPWLWVVEPRGNSPVRAIPPSGHVAGCYARHDLETGVHRAPANTPLPWLQDVTVPVGDGTHDILNPLGINAIRTSTGSGIRVLGARTMSSEPRLRQINVRRLLLMIREAVDVSTQWAAFEPNNHETRRKIILSLSSFLSALWQSGALVGNAPEQSFFVKCDEENNPTDERANGRLQADVGIAPSYPMEFIVIRVGRQANELQISESIIIARAA